MEVRLKDRAAVALMDYRRAHQALNDQAVDIELRVQSMRARFMETDKGFLAWPRPTRRRRDQGPSSGRDQAPAPRKVGPGPGRTWLAPPTGNSAPATQPPASLTKASP